ncbi:hypothetical protein MJT46_009462 [Ovis ammon polii x Ovis aries]|nr:hypothetical protein MJT46_009462 [Ovis ammon polii x Ovis aries]
MTGKDPDPPKANLLAGLSLVILQELESSLQRNCKRIEIQREKANQARDTVGQDKKTEIEKPSTSSKKCMHYMQNLETELGKTPKSRGEWTLGSEFEPSLWVHSSPLPPFSIPTGNSLSAMAREWTWTSAQGINVQNFTKCCWRMNIKQEVKELKSTLPDSQIVVAMGDPFSCQALYYYNYYFPTDISDS